MSRAYDTFTEGTVAQILKKQGQWVERDEVVVRVQTDKVTIDVQSSAAGIIQKMHVASGGSILKDGPVFDVDSDAPKPASASKPVTLEKTVAVEKTVSSDKPSSVAKEAITPSKQSPAPQPSQPAVKTTQPTIQGKREESREPMSRLRLRVAKRLKDAQNNYALLTTFQEVDMGEAQDLRKQMGEEFLKKYGVKLGFMSIFMRAATMALEEYPVVNSVIDGEEIVRRNFIDISVAVATPSGLLVPVVRDCQNKPFWQLEQELAALAKKGKDGKITVEDMQGGTFTISNGGVFGSLLGTPIINTPQSAILGMHAITQRAVVKNDQIVARPIMFVALTYDHRLLDGKDAVLFLKRIQLLVEDPRRMLLAV